MPAITEGDTFYACRKHVGHYRMAYFQAIISMLVVGGVAWGIATSAIPGETWDKMHLFDKRNILIGVLVLMLKDLQSFMNQTLNRTNPQPPVSPKIPDMPVTPSTRPPGNV